MSEVNLLPARPGSGRRCGSGRRSQQLTPAVASLHNKTLLALKRQLREMKSPCVLTSSMGSRLHLDTQEDTINPVAFWGERRRKTLNHSNYRHLCQICARQKKSCEGTKQVEQLRESSCPLADECRRAAAARDAIV